MLDTGLETGRPAQARSGPAQRSFLSGRAGQLVKIVGPGGPSFLSGRPGPAFYLNLMHFISVINNPNY